VVAAATSLGLVVAVLLGGVAADRFPKRTVLIGVESVRVVVPVLAGVLALAGVLEIRQLAALAFVVGAAGGFYYPTWSAVVPALLPADELLAANGIEGMLRPLAQQAAGPALAGVLLPIAAFGLSTLLWGMVVASLVLGVTDAAAMVIWGTLLQRRVPTHLLGRVSSLDFFVSLALMPISMALAGPVGERVGIPVTFVVAAVAPPVLAVVALLAWRLPRDELGHPLERAPTTP